MIASSHPNDSASVVEPLPMIAKKPKMIVKMLMKMPNDHA